MEPRAIRRSNRAATFAARTRAPSYSPTNCGKQSRSINKQLNLRLRQRRKLMAHISAADRSKRTKSPIGLTVGLPRNKQASVKLWWSYASATAARFHSCLARKAKRSRQSARKSRWDRQFTPTKRGDGTPCTSHPRYFQICGDAVKRTCSPYSASASSAIRNAKFSRNLLLSRANSCGEFANLSQVSACGATLGAI